MDGIKRIITPLWPAFLWVFLLAFSTLGYCASSQKVGECKRYAHYFYAGARQHHNEMPRELRWMTVPELMALRQGFPEWKEGDKWPLPFNVVRDDGESDAEKIAIINAYTEGWDLAAAHPGVTPDESLKDRAMDRCMNGTGT